jgi:hypothetical protein
MRIATCYDGFEEIQAQSQCRKNLTIRFRILEYSIFFRIDRVRLEFEI